MRAVFRNLRESTTSISPLCAHARTKRSLLLSLAMLSVTALSACAQGAVQAQGLKARPAAWVTVSPISSPESSWAEYADLKLSYSVRRLAHLAGLPPETTFDLCWNFNFFLMVGLMVWKGGPLLTAAFEARSRSIHRAIEEARCLSNDAAKRLAEVERRWAQLDCEIAAIQSRAEEQLKNEEQILRAKAGEDIRRLMDYSKFEIEKATQQARQEIQVFATDLAVGLARKSILIDKRTDQALLHVFIAGLGHQEPAPTSVPPSAREITSA